MTATAISAGAGQDAMVPSKLFSARELAEFALQKISAFTTMDASAEPRDLDRTLGWMELTISDLHGRERLQWLIPQTIEFDLEVDTPSYLLSDIAGTAFPGLRIAYPISAKARVNDGTETKVDIIRRDAYEEVSPKDTSGVPNQIYIDRTTDDPTIYVTPVPSQSEVTTTIRLLVQTYAPSVLGANADSQQAGNVMHGFDRAWQLWLVNATALQIGNGPVRQCTQAKLRDLRDETILGLSMLMPYNNRENQSLRLRRTQRYGG